MRCLLIRNWSEDGVYWAVKYLLNRLTEIRHHRCLTDAFFGRSRSNSVPKSSAGAGVSRGSRHDILNAEHLTWSDLQERASQLNRCSYNQLGGSSLGVDDEGAKARVAFNVDKSK
jgi:hypothetical protein